VKKIMVAAGVALTLLAVFGAAAPVELLEADNQVFVQDNGAVDVIYSLTFLDNEGRTQIRKVGQFYEPVHFTRGFLNGEGGPQPVTTQNVGGGYYRVDFTSSTRAGQQYTLELHFRSNHRFADPTESEGRQLLAVWFNPVRWSMPIGRSVVKLVLPLALPAEVARAEDITSAMVDGLGVVTDPGSLVEQDHWAFVFADY
jgi:hypothetical protein